MRAIGATCQTATRKIASEPAATAQTWRRESSPAGSSRPAVRGLRPSIACVDEPVCRHRERARADHRHGDPGEQAHARRPARAEDRARVRVGQREHGLLEAHQRGQPPRRQRGCAHVPRPCEVGASRSSAIACPRTGASTRESLAAGLRAPGQVDHDRSPPRPRDAAREHAVRRVAQRVRPQSLVDPGAQALEHRQRRLGRHVARARSRCRRSRARGRRGRRRTGRAARPRSALARPAPRSASTTSNPASASRPDSASPDSSSRVP